MFETLKTLVAPNPAEAAERSAANPLQRLLREKFSIRPIRTLHSVDFGVLWALAIGYESAGALRDLGTLYGPPSEPHAESANSETSGRSSGPLGSGRPFVPG